MNGILVYLFQDYLICSISLSATPYSSSQHSYLLLREFLCQARLICEMSDYALNCPVDPSIPPFFLNGILDNNNKGTKKTTK